MKGDINQKMKKGMQETANDEINKRKLMKLMTGKMGKDVKKRMNPKRDESVEVT